MGRLISLTMLLTLGASGIATEGAPPDDAAKPADTSASAPATRPNPPCHPSVYLKTAQKLFKAGDSRAAAYLKAADDYRDMLTVEDQKALDLLKSSANAPADASVAKTTADMPDPSVAPSAAPADSRKEKAKELVAQAREELANGHVDEAARLCKRAEAMNAAFSIGEDYPGKVLDEIRASQSAGLKSRGVPPTDAKQQARWLLQAAREQLGQGHFDEAEQKLNEARAMNAHWTLFDDTPAKVAADLEKLRPKTPSVGAGRGDRRQAKEKLKQARQMMDNGDYAGAEAVALEVASWKLRFNMMEDNPQKVISAVKAIRKRDLARRGSSRNQPSEGIYTGLVAQARQLQAQGKLDEATAKAHQAMAMNVTPSLTADRAENVLHDVEMMRSQAAQTPPNPALAAGNPPSDPALTPAAAQAPAAEPASDPMKQGDATADQPKLAASQALAAQEAPANVPPPMGEPAANPAQPQVVDPNAVPVAADPNAPPVLADANPPASMAPAAPTSALEKARNLLVNGNFPAARRAAEQAKAEGAGLEADAMILQVAQTEQAAALQMYESVLMSLRKGGEEEMNHARDLLGELTTLNLDESTQQKVQDLLTRMPRDGAGHAQLGSGLDDKEAVAAQKLNAEVGTKVAEARRLMETDPEKAINLLTATIDQVKASGCKESVTRNMTARLNNAIEIAKQDKVKFDQKMQEKSFKAEIERKRLRILEADKHKQELMAEFMHKAEEATSNGKYEEAEKFYTKAAEIDPNEIAAIAGRTVSRTRRLMAREMKSRDGLRSTFEDLSIGVSEAGIVPYGLDKKIVDMSDFVELSARRRATNERLSPKQDAAVVETVKKLNQPVTIHMEKTSLGEAIKYLNELTGLNIIPDKKALAEAGLSLNSPVEFHSEKLPLRQALKYFLSEFDLTYAVDEGAVLITSQQTNKLRTVVKVYNVADLVVKAGNRRPDGTMAPSSAPPSPMDPASMLQAQANAMNGAPNQFVPPPGVSTSTNFGEREIDFGPLINLIEKSIAPGTWNENHSADSMGASYGQGAGFAGAGGAGDTPATPNSITPFYLSISLIIKAVPDIHDDIVDLLRQLRRLQDLQVSIEVRFITLDDSFYEQIGVDFDFSIQSNAIGKKSSLAVPNPAVALTTTGTSTATAGTTGGTAGTTGGTANTTSTAPYLVNPIRDHTSGAGSLVVGHTGDNPQGNGNPGEFTQDFQIPFTQGGAGAITPFNALTGNTAATFGIAFLSDLEVYLFLTAVQGDTRSNLVQAPKVTTFNGASATVQNVTQRFYVQSLTPVVGGAAVAFSPQIGSIPDGVTLTVTPVVSADRRYVRMTLQPQFITFIQFDTFSTPAGVGGGGLGGTGVLINSQVQLPEYSQTTVQTTVTVPDGGTILLGGVKRLREERTEIGVPILGKVPLIDRLFRNIGIGRTTDSLMLMVSPRIVILEEEEEKLGVPALENTY